MTHYAVDAIGSRQPGLDAAFAERVRAGVAPSSVYAVVHDGQVLAWGGFADETVTPLPTLDTAYRIASCTKSFTVAALLLLRDDGWLELDDPVDRYLAVRTIGGRGAMPTLGQLASMRGGFPTDDPWGDRQESLTAAQFDALSAQGFRLVHEPGTRYEYSNLGFALLGRVVERVSGRPYPEFVLERVVEPLGIAGLGYDETVAAEAVAAGFARFDDEWVRQPTSTPGAFSSIGGMFATPRALAAWMGWLAAAWNADDDLVGSLQASSRREMQTPHTPIGARLDYGLGLRVEQDARHGRIVSHSGGYPGYGANMRWHPESGVGLLVFENARYSGAVRPASAGLTAVLDSIAVPERLDLWPETRAAREVVERLLRDWQADAALAIFADNVELDEPLERRRSHVADLTAAVGLDEPPRPLEATAAWSDGPAHLVWTVRGRRGTLRCEIRMTPELRPRVQTLIVRIA